MFPPPRPLPPVVAIRRETELDEAMRKMRALLRDMEEAPSRDIAKRGTQLLRTTRDTISNYKTQTRMTTDKSVRDAHKQGIKEAEGELRELEARFKELKQAAEQSALRGAGGEGESKRETNADYLAKIHDVQDQTEDALQRTLETVNQTKNIADATHQELIRQGDQLDSIYRELEGIDSNLTRTQRLIQIFSRRMMTDKAIQCFALSNILLIVAVVGLAASGYDLTGGGSESAPEPT